ncbi:glycosyltransferase family 4 protein [Polynucleobacter campilacus]|uniref:Glycosyl transferase family 1 domain-containing protein n=1 Tax=Polynucleobacter campilacus TaxID=1743163 RepID=A0A254Q5B7_9BURK|nr:glycosyltransferase family 4 protein [Polynucleobacter campilacus]OWS70692.1 hypothetical protein CBI31_00095 [Polynucleobacter campilacus]
MKTLLFISEVFYPSESATSVYMAKIALKMTCTFNVKAICIDFENNLPRFENFNDIKIERINIRKFKINNKFIRIIRGLYSSFLLLCKALINIRKDDIVFVVTNPPLIPGFIALICKLKKAKCIIRVDDVYPEALIISGVISKTSFFLPILHFLFRGFYFLADKVIVLGSDMEHVIKSGQVSTHLNTQVIRNWGDSVSVFPSSKFENAILNSLGICDKFVILIAGTVGYVQGVDTIIESAKILQKKHPDILFLFVGGGSQAQWVKSQVIDFSLDNVIFFGTLPKAEQNIFLNACDVSLLALKKDMFGIGVPSRFYNYLAAGKPVIASVDIDSEIAVTILENNIGFVSSAGDAQALVDAILCALNLSSDDLKLMSQAARSLLMRKYSEDVIVNQYKNLFLNT